MKPTRRRKNFNYNRSGNSGNHERNSRNGRSNSYRNERQRIEKKNRLGYTTGTCAAGAAKAAAICLLTGDSPETISLLLPSGKRFWFPIKGFIKENGRVTARASTVAADPNSPEVLVHLSYEEEASYLSGNLSFNIRGGTGVGKVIKPGLPVPVGEDAIFPESQNLIRENLRELTKYMHFGSICQLSVTIEVPEGERLARQSLTERLGIEGGVAIQETPALNRMATPEAWQRWITQALTIAKETGANEVILTPGARSERFSRAIFPDTPPESFVLTADHIEHALTQAKALGFSKVFYVTHFGKMLKSMTGKMKMSPKAFITSLIPVYHVALVEKAPEEILTGLNQCKTPREGLELLIREGMGNIFFRICQRAHRNLSRLVGNEFPLEVILLSYDGEILSRFKTEEKYGFLNVLDQPFSSTLQPVQNESK
ncbi:MAG: hypothetical protein DSY91_05110 [Deltaproteobacteria bacterium]|nr:MAG: hypothetical protein DSY91_05110 [Deltaproteobacteria bacterium]